MKLSNLLKSFEEESQKDDVYWVEKAKLDFAVNLEKQRLAMKMTYSAIAKKIGTSAAYITKIFRGDSNMTIDTMVKLARATGGELDIQIIDKASQTAQWDMALIKNRAHSISHTTPQTATVYTFPAAANEPSAWAKLAA